MTVLYTKYKAENNALWTIYVKYGLKSTERFGNLSMEKYGILKWKMCRNPISTRLSWGKNILEYGKTVAFFFKHTE